MSAPPADVTAARVSDECRAAAQALAALQDRVRLQVGGGTDDELLRDMQALDAVQQTLDDLATLFSALSVKGATAGLRLTDDVTAGIKQTTLRQRLLGTPDHDMGDTVELF